jgi:putative transposase
MLLPYLQPRCAAEVSVFREYDSYLFVLHKMKAYCPALHIAPIAYCLLPNHYHVLVRQDGDRPAGLLPQRVFNAYNKASNERYGHSGTLFQGPCRVRPVDQDDYLLHLCRYIHANPVIHGLVSSLADWPCSNYPEWTGLRFGPLVDLDLVRAHYPHPQDYERFVQEYVVERRLPKELDAHLKDCDA